MENGIKYMVRTYCRTYNHEKYILDALDGFAMQETSFPVVTTIVEDCSTDGTTEIIKKYLKDNFSLDDNIISYQRETDYAHIVYARHKSNPSCFFAVNFLKYNHYRDRLDVFKYISGWSDKSKYFAICEGDDYWTDPLKLQRQVDFLEEHPDYSMCCHNVDWYQGTELIKRNIKSDFDIDLPVGDIISHGGFYINTCSILYRADLARHKSEFQKIATYGDHPLYIKLALQGKVRCLHEVMGRYRYMVNGSWTNRNYLDNHAKALHYYNTICWMFSLNKETNGKYKAAIVSLLGGIFRYTYEYGGFPNNWEYIKMSVFFGRKVLIRAYKDVLIQLCPHAYALFRRIIDI